MTLRPSTKPEVSEPSTKKSKKDKLESIRESLSKLETQRTLASGNKRTLDSIERVEKRLLDLLKQVKQN